MFWQGPFRRGGTEITILYVVIGLCAGIAGGMAMDAIHAERWQSP